VRPCLISPKRCAAGMPWSRRKTGLFWMLLADEVVFRSLAVFAPQEGKALTTGYLSAALKVLIASLRYVAQWHDHSSAVLEFEADLDGVCVQVWTSCAGTPGRSWPASPSRSARDARCRSWSSS
jgi:hypothetical protein